MDADPKKVMLYRAPDAAEAAVLTLALEAEGISATQVGGAATITYGELGQDALQVEIWVSADRADHGRKIIEAYYEASDRTENRENWTCPKCGETNERNFEVCWKCQGERINP